MKRSSAHRRKEQRQLKSIRENRHTGLVFFLVWAAIAYFA